MPTRLPPPRRRANIGRNRKRRPPRRSRETRSQARRQGGTMRKSDDRLLVTHVGSLPRGGPLNELLIRSEQGEAVDPKALDAEVERRVAHVFARQREIGIDVCNDGEQGRVGFQTYVAQRMSGFAGQSNRPKPRDVSDFPDFGKLLVER